MLDLKRIRFETEAVQQLLKKRGDRELGSAIDRLLSLDDRRRRLIQSVEELKARRNEASKEIAERKKRREDATSLIDEMRGVADEISQYDDQLGKIEKDIETLLLQVPNTPMPEVPAGDESANELVRSWGEPVEPADWQKPHWEIGASLGILDLERGAKIAGSGFPVYVGVGARLQRALVAFMLDLHLEEHGYTEVYPPYLATSRTMTGTGQLPKLASDAYHITGDDLWLIPTAEVPVTALHADEVLRHNEVPRCYVAYSACFRREAGAAGRETRGINRVHQFDKVELVRLERPADSAAALEEMTEHAEAVLRHLGVPYRVMRLAAGELAQQSAMSYDIEVWAPGVERWLEVSSCSNCTDYQARRTNTRFRSEPGAKPDFVHTLNGSGVALPRTVIALLENYQREDGSVELPEVLHEYMGSTRIEPV